MKVIGSCPYFEVSPKTKKKEEPMTVNKLIRKLLKLKDLKVNDFKFKFREKALHLWATPQKWLFMPHV